MSNYWITCKWLLMEFLSFNDWLEIVDTASKLGCNLHLDFTDWYNRRDADGYYVISPTLEAPSPEAFTQWMQKCSQFAAVSDCQPSQKTDFQFEPLNGLDMSRVLVSVSADINRFIECNQAIRDHTAMWMSGSWQVHPTPTETILEWLQITQKWNAELFYDSNRTQLLYLKVHNVVNSDQLLAELKSVMPVEHWGWIFSHIFKHVDVSKLLPLNFETLSAYQADIHDKSNL